MNNVQNLAAPGLAEESDPELILRVRNGESAAYEQLFLRHRDVALRLARRLSDPERAHDLCSEAFAKVLDLLQRGKGPDVAFRAYLLTTVRTVHLNQIRAGSRENLVADHEPWGDLFAVEENPDDRFNQGAISRAFDKLPERWQAALWLSAVEGLSNEQIGQHLGIRPSAVASLTFRARAGLREAYLSEHVLDTADAQCQRVTELLPGYLRGTMSARRRANLEEHLDGCARCTVALTELDDVDRRLGAWLGPLVVGSASTAAALWPHVTVETTGALIGKSAGLFELVRSTTSFKLAAAGVAGAIAVGTGALFLDGPDAPVQAPPPMRVDQHSRVVLTPRPTPTASPEPAPVAPAPPAASVAAPEPVAPVQWTGDVGTMKWQPVIQGGLLWKRVTVPVSNPEPGSTMVITSNHSMRATVLQSTTPSGWVCQEPTVDWHDGAPLATTRTECVFTGGDPTFPQLDLLIGGLTTVRALLSPPEGVTDPQPATREAVLHIL